MLISIININKFYASLRAYSFDTSIVYRSGASVDCLHSVLA